MKTGGNFVPFAAGDVLEGWRQRSHSKARLQGRPRAGPVGAKQWSAAVGLIRDELEQMDELGKVAMEQRIPAN